MRAGVIPGRYPVPRPLTSNLTLIVKRLVKGRGGVGCPMRLAANSDHRGMRADVISGRYPVPRPLALNLTLNVKYQVKRHGCVRCPGRLTVA